jgi:hypothetical protein
VIARWEQGRATIEAMLSERKLERVPANRELADEYLSQAQAHLSTSSRAPGHDPVGEFHLAYDSARKAMAAILLNQGLRPTSGGGHVVVGDAILAQLDPPLGETFRPFRWMRPLRNDNEYPRPDRPTATAMDAEEGRRCAREMVAKAQELLDVMPTFGS